jgi:small-conductance mechanosensitive channel
MKAPIVDFAEWLQALTTPEAAIGLAVVAACVVLAAGVTWRVRATGARSDILLAGGVFGCVLFPLLALLAVGAAHYLMTRLGPPASLAVFRLALPVLLSLVIIRSAARVLRVAFPQSQAGHAVERWVSWIAWAAVVLWVTGLLPVLHHELGGVRWKTGGVEVSLWSLVEGVVTASAVLLVVLWVSAAVEARLLAADGLKGADLSVRMMAANALRAMLLFAGLLVALSAAGIPLGALGVLGGAVGVGIGFGLQKLAANYVSGFVILAERSLRIGDTVKVDGFEGRITDIHTRYTVIRALTGRESIVPNELLITQRVESASLSDPRVVLRTTVQVAYGTDLERLIPRLRDAVAQVPRVLSDPMPGVLLNSFAADGLELGVGFWISDPENGEANVRSDVNLAILRALNEDGVEIPFPQRVVRQG